MVIALFIALQTGPLTVQTPRSQEQTLSDEAAAAELLRRSRRANNIALQSKTLQKKLVVSPIMSVEQWNAIAKSNVTQSAKYNSVISPMPSQIKNCSIVSQNSAGVILSSRSTMNGRSAYYQCSNYQQVISLEIFSYKQNTLTGMSMSLPQETSTPFRGGFFATNGRYEQSGQCRTSMDWVGKSYSISITRISYEYCNKVMGESKTIDLLNAILHFLDI